MTLTLYALLMNSYTDFLKGLCKLRQKDPTGEITPEEVLAQRKSQNTEPEKADGVANKEDEQSKTRDKQFFLC